MGDRAVVVFHDKSEVSPAVYVHWAGSEVPEYLKELKEFMRGRYNDASYAAARFAGLCHAKISGNTGLGLFPVSLSLDDIQDAAKCEDESQGDAGFVVVNTSDFSWTAYGGYLADKEQT